MTSDPSQYLRRTIAARHAFDALLVHGGRVRGYDIPSGVHLVHHLDSHPLGTVDHGSLHGPWSHPHTAQVIARNDREHDLISDRYAHDRAQRIAALVELPAIGARLGSTAPVPTLADLWRDFMGVR